MSAHQPRTDSGRTESPWMDVETPGSDAPALPDASDTDVCVIGAGIAGLSTAYQLVREGARVIVLDDGPIGGGETGRTSAHLASALDDHFFELEKLHGRDGARLAAESHAAAIDWIAEIARDERIECDFRRVDGYLFAGRGKPTDDLDAEYEAARRAGLSVERMGESCWSWYDTGPCLRFRHQAEFHPLRYLSGLAGAIRRKGGRIYTGVHAARAHGGKRCRVVTSDRQVVHSASLVVATNSPIHTVVSMHTRQTAYRTYLVALEVPAGVVPHALYWDMLDPYHYVRVYQRSGREAIEQNPRGVTGGGSAGVEWLLVGGEDHRTGQADDGDTRFTSLEQWARQRFPMASAVAMRWSGQVLEPTDSLAYIGKSPGLHQNVYLATGDSGNGLTHGTIAGVLLTDLILGRENPWAELYDPSRSGGIRSLGERARENANTAVQYGEWLTPGEVKSAGDIEPGKGAIVRRGLRKVAIYRDEDGAVHERSAVCTHLGGVVAWNSTERSWDCPCHGSRFGVDGRVLNGPARRGLSAPEPALESAERRRVAGDK